MPEVSNDYIIRINRVLDYIDKHICEQMTLDELAGVANFSKFHFHRLFALFIGEPLNAYIMRSRMELSAARLLSNRNASISDIAFDVGFSSVSTFSRAFKKIMGMSPSEYRDSKIGQLKSNICKQEGNICTQNDTETPYFCNTIFSTINRRAAMFNKNNIKFEIKKLPAIDLAYVRYIGPYAGDEKLFAGLFGKIMGWAGPRQLLNFPETKAVCVYHNDPNVTEPEKLRVSVGVTVPADTKVDGEIGKMTLEAGKYAVGHFEISTDEFKNIWDNICGAIVAAGFEPADGPCFELYYNDASTHPEHKHILDICIPVK